MTSSVGHSSLSYTIAFDNVMNLVYLSLKEEDVTSSQINLLLKSYKQSQRLLQLLIQIKSHAQLLRLNNQFNYAHSQSQDVWLNALIKTI